MSCFGVVVVVCGCDCVGGSEFVAYSLCISSLKLSIWTIAQLSDKHQSRMKFIWFLNNNSNDDDDDDGDDDESNM